MKTLFIGLLGFFLVSCGKAPTASQTTSGDLGPEGSELSATTSFANSSYFAPEGSSILSNLFSDIVHTVFSSGTTNCLPTVIAQALPPNVEPSGVSHGTSSTHTYEKTLNSSIFGTKLVHVVYKINYNYDAHWNGKGKYLTNLTFVPIRVDVDPIWSVVVTAKSEPPRNFGTKANPIARLKFTLTFQASGTSTHIVTDEFEVSADTGELETSFQDF